MSWLDSSKDIAEAERQLIECIDIVTSDEQYVTIDVTPSINSTGRWSQERFLTIANFLLIESRKIYMKKKHDYIPVIVSPQVATAFQCLNSGAFVQFDNMGERLKNGSTVYAIGLLYGTIIVYMDMMATRDYAFLFSSDRANVNNSSILDEFPSVNINISDLTCKVVRIVGLNTYFSPLEDSNK